MNDDPENAGPCAGNPDRFLAWLDGELDPGEAAAVEAHLQVCEGCRGDAASLAALHRDLCLQSTAPDAGEEAAVQAVLESVRTAPGMDGAARSTGNGRATVLPRPPRRPSTRAVRPAWLPPLAAAAVLAAACTFLVTSLQKNRHDPTNGKPETGPKRESAVSPPEASAPGPAEGPVAMTDASRQQEPTSALPGNSVTTAPAPEGPAIPPPSPDIAPTPPPVAAVPVAPPPAADPVPPVRAPAGTEPVATAATGPAIARVETVKGNAFVVTPQGRTAATAGSDLRTGQGIETRGYESRLAVRCADGTRIELRGNTTVSQVTDRAPAAKGRSSAGKGWTVAEGTLTADVSRQPSDLPMVITTPTAEATVLGTKFVLECGAESTRVEVQEGRVKLLRLQDRQSVTIPAGYFARSAKGDAPVAHAVRGEAGLLALYPFKEGDGTVVHDESGAAAPLDLRIGTPESVRWRPRGLLLQGPAHIESIHAAGALVNACRQKHEISLEAWVRPDPVAQQGPAGIAFLSGCSVHPFALLGYGGTETPAAQFRGFFRTTEVEGDARSWLAVADRAAAPRLVHLVFTRVSPSTATLFVDGVERASGRIPGEIPVCTVPAQFHIGSGLGGEHPWRGEIHLVAVYGRALTADEVKRNFKAGLE